MVIKHYTREKQMRWSVTIPYIYYSFNKLLIPYGVIDLKNFLPLICILWRQVFTGGAQAIDGCATFFRRDRFSHVKKYEVWRERERVVCINFSFIWFFLVWSLCLCRLNSTRLLSL